MRSIWCQRAIVRGVACPHARATLDTLRTLRLEARFRDVVSYGIHAGFPLCCIYFYARIWIRWSVPIPELYEAANHDPDETTRQKLWATEPVFMHAIGEQFKYLDETQSFEVGYVRCPWCVINDHRVDVRDVDTRACACWLST